MKQLYQSQLHRLPMTMGQWESADHHFKTGRVEYGVMP